MATATSRRVSSAPTAAIGRRVACLLVLGALGVGAGEAAAHPPATGEPRHHACERDVEAARAFDPTRLGSSEAELRARFGEALVVQKMEPHRGPRPPGLEAKSTSSESSPARWAGQLRLRRRLESGDVAFVEYDLAQGVVYRIRWRLADRFSVPIMDELVAQATACYGAPHYDQEPEWRLAEAKASLRRSGWQRDDRLLEVRQLHPLNGGPVFMTTTDLAAVRKLVAGGGAASPDPVSSPPWWLRKRTPSGELSAEEREALTRDFARLLSRSAF